MNDTELTLIGFMLLVLVVTTVTATRRAIRAERMLDECHRINAGLASHNGDLNHKIIELMGPGEAGEYFGAMIERRNSNE